MTRFFVTILLSAMLSCLGMGAENDLDAQLKLKKGLLSQFIQTWNILIELRGIPDKTTEQVNLYHHMNAAHLHNVAAILFFGIKTGPSPRGRQFTQKESALIAQRSAELLKIEHGTPGTHLVKPMTPHSDPL